MAAGTTSVLAFEPRGQRRYGGGGQDGFAYVCETAQRLKEPGQSSQRVLCIRWDRDSSVSVLLQVRGQPRPGQQRSMVCINNVQ